MVDYTLSFLVTETHNGSACPVQEGHLKISNPAAKENQSDTLNYKANLSGFPSHQFKKGSPNVVDPHIYGINVEYLSEEGDFLGNIILPVFVEGEVEVPGTDIIVDPGDQVQFPLFVLRDPPGDGSFSYISSGETIKESVNISNVSGDGGSYYNEGEVTAGGIGGSFSFEAGGETGTSGSNDWSYEITTTQTISTSADPNFVGPKADVIIGVGWAMQYGLIQDFRAGECDTIFQTQKLGYSTKGVNTTWSYTVQQVEDIITGYKNDSLRVEAGTLELSRNDTVLTKIEARGFLGSKIYNWEQVLVYHSEKTLPHYLLCANEAKEQLPANYRSAIKEWQDEFCPLVDNDTDRNNEFHLKPAAEIVWNQELIDKYNAAVTAVRNLNKGLNIELYEFDADTDLAAYRDIQYDNSFGVLAENKTFGGGTTEGRFY